MLKLSTKTKLHTGSLVFKIVRTWFRFLGKKTESLITIRNGITWKLNLVEGFDLYIYLFGRHEPSSYLAMKRYVKTGDIVLDIGANVGGHTLPLAEMVSKTGSVIAIEPTLWAFNKMCDNISLNTSLQERIIPLQVLLTDVDNDEAAPKELYSSWTFDDKEIKHATLMGTLKSTVGTRIRTLDSLVAEMQLQKIDFIKLDVDGFELKVLKGANNILRRFKPKMLIELCPHVLKEHNSSLEEYFEILKKYNYQIFEEVSGKQLELNSKVIEKMIPVNGGINVIALFQK